MMVFIVEAIMNWKNIISRRFVKIAENWKIYYTEDNLLLKYVDET